MKKKMLLMMVCALVFTGCGKAEPGEDTASTAEVVEVTPEDDGEDAVGEVSSELSIQDEMAMMEAKSLEFENANWDEMTQTDMNITASEWYQLWDDELNSLWSRLSDELDADTKATVLEEQRAWISRKEANVTASGMEAFGGSLQPLLEYSTAEEMTRARAYILAGYLAAARGESFEISEEIQESINNADPSVDFPFEYLSGKWIMDEEIYDNSFLTVEKFVDSNFTSDEFEGSHNWIAWITDGDVFTEEDVYSYTQHSITFERKAGGYCRISENLAGGIDLEFGDSPDSFDTLIICYD